MRWRKIVNGFIVGVITFASMTLTSWAGEVDAEQESIIEGIDYEASVVVEAEAEASGTCGENLTWTYNDGTLTISGAGEMSDFEYYQSGSSILDKIPWQKYRNEIKEIVLDERITSIGANAFLGCVNLTHINLPNEITKIGKQAFAFCGLVEVIIPDRVTSIGFGAFKSNANLISVDLPEGLSEIAINLFYNCRKLTNIIIPSNVTSIGSSAFQFCDNLSSVKIPSNVTSIGRAAFYSCYYLNSIEIASSVTSIGEVSFYRCMNLTDIKIPSSVTYIGAEAFSECEKLKEIIVDSNNAYYKDIDGVLFYGNTDLHTYPAGKTDEIYLIPSGVERIYQGAFDGCTSLKGIEIPSSLIEIGTDAFGSCKKLEWIYFVGDKPVIGDLAFRGTSVDIYYPENNDTWVGIRDNDSDYGGELWWIVPGSVHRWGIWQVEKYPTTEETGLKLRTCMICGEIEEEIMDVFVTDKTILVNLITSTEELDERDYTTASWTRMTAVRQAAEAVLENNGATQDEVEAAATDLLIAIQQLQEGSANLPYEDVFENDWFYDAVSYTYQNELMTGMDATHFGPYSQLARAQFALILYRMEGKTEVNTDKSFGDITGDEWYGDAVLWAAEAGLVTGYENGNFGPTDLITREQMAVMMYRYARYFGLNVDARADISMFADGNAVSSFSENAMSWAVGEGVITGKENGTRIDPQGNTARCEAAAIIERFIAVYSE